jgi:succinyl-CoA synthetase beta subunit
MELLEHQAKALLRRYNIPVPRGEVAETPSQAGNAAFRLGGQVMVKALVPGPGRREAGVLKNVPHDVEAGRFAASIFRQRVTTQGTGPNGAVVEKFLVEQYVPAQREVWVHLVRRAGGTVEITARTTEGTDQKTTVPPGAKLTTDQGQDLASRLGFSGAAASAFLEALNNLYRAFQEKDLTWIEATFAITNDQRPVAVHATAYADNRALSRHPELLLLGVK